MMIHAYKKEPASYNTVYIDLKCPYASFFLHIKYVKKNHLFTSNKLFVNIILHKRIVMWLSFFLCSSPVYSNNNRILWMVFIIIVVIYFPLILRIKYRLFQKSFYFLRFLRLIVHMVSMLSVCISVVTLGYSSRLFG